MLGNQSSHFIKALVLFMGISFFTGKCAYGQTAQTPPVSTDPSSTISETTPEGAVEMTDIHDIKPPEALGLNQAYVYYGLLALLLLALFIVGWLYWQKRRKQKTKTETVTILPPEQIALNAIDHLFKRGFEDGRAFYFELSAILRNYIEDRYTVNAPEMTSEELLPLIENLSVGRESQQDLKNLIRSTDPIKFAASPVHPSKMEGDIEFVRRFVIQTTPVEEHV